MIGLEAIYLLMGLMLAGIALVNLLDRCDSRHLNKAAFWGLYAATFLLGSHLPDFTNGVLVIGMVLVSSIRGLGRGGPESVTREAREARARRLGNRLFVPALLIPAVTLFGTTVLKGIRINDVPLIEAGQVTVISLGLATIVALIAGMTMLRAPWQAPIQEARRLMDSVGWAAVLPQMLAALGALFAIAGVGGVISTLVNRWIPLDTAIVAVATYTVGMALFTIIMGNAFAAFPVMTAGIGLPLIVQRFGGDPAIMAAVGMLSGFCGTLMTPMAANFNIVPAALLELPDQHAVIKVQIPTGHPAPHCQHPADVLPRLSLLTMPREAVLVPTGGGLTESLASRFAALALAHVTREYPNKLDHVLNGPEDVRSPRELHPIFYGSFDWHSCVHGHWLLAHLLPDVPVASRRATHPRPARPAVHRRSRCRRAGVSVTTVARGIRAPLRMGVAAHARRRAGPAREQRGAAVGGGATAPRC